MCLCSHCMEPNDVDWHPEDTASVPRSGDRMQSQEANPDIDSWESEGGHSGLRAKIDDA